MEYLIKMVVLNELKTTNLPQKYLMIMIKIKIKTNKMKIMEYSQLNGPKPMHSMSDDVESKI